MCKIVAETEVKCVLCGRSAPAGIARELTAGGITAFRKVFCSVDCATFYLRGGDINVQARVLAERLARGE
jgi:hypothetical protein